jgi:hypothetical protein
MKTKKISLPKTEANGTKVIDLQAWLRDVWGAYARGEITREQYETEATVLRARIDALTRN